jgi:integrating conjugative element protein (TIGR03759 family)
MPQARRLPCLTTVAALLLGAASVRAGDAITPEPAATTTRTTTLDRTELTTTDRVRAEHWDLSLDEWHRYQTLMDGIRGSISPATISPIEVLGIHARDEAERRKYAERWAVMMREDAERILAFQRAYDEANRALYPDAALIDVALLPDRANDEPALRRSDRVLFFARPDCTACDALLARMLARLDRIAGIDVYLLDVTAGDEAAIRAWANARGIRPEWVQSRQVTLNFDGGALNRIGAGQRDLPVLLRRRDDAVTPLSGSAL